MKHFNLLAIGILSLLLVGCSYNANEATSAVSSQMASDDIVTPSTAEHKLSLCVPSSEQGMYTVDSIANGYGNIFYIDFETMQQIPLCDTPNCTHSNDSCTAWLQIDESGFLPGAYHWVALRNFFAFYQVAQHNGMEQIFPSVYTEWLRKTAMAEFYQQKPDFSLPITNDSNVTTRHQIQLSALMAAGLLPAEDALFRLSNGREGKKPSYTSHFFPQARLAIMRSGWDSEALYASLDMGPWGCNHMNDDQLNLEVSAYGRNLLVNSGRWRYTTSPGIDWLDKAEYFKSTAAYNSVLCDGMNQVHGDADGEMRIAADSDYACGTFCAGYGYNGGAQVSREVGSTTQTACVVPDARHKREVFYAKEAGFLIVRDTLTAEQAHRYTQIWHTVGGQVEREGNVCFSCFEDANFVMVQCGDPEIEIFCGSEEPFKGWNCPAYDHLVPAPQIEASLTGQTVVFETLILPTRGPVDRSMLPVFEKEEKDGKTIYQVTVGGKTTSVEAGCMWRLVK